MEMTTWLFLQLSVFTVEYKQGLRHSWRCGEILSNVMHGLFLTAKIITPPKAQTAEKLAKLCKKRALKGLERINVFLNCEGMGLLTQ